MESRHEAWLEKPPVGVTLGMTIEELLAPSKRKKSRSKPPRPQQSYILFRKNFRALNESMKFGDVSSVSRAEWKKSPPVVREFFEMLSGEAKKRPYIKYPNYKYEPKRNPLVFRGQKQRGRPRRPVNSPDTSPETSPEVPQNDTAELELSFPADNFVNLNSMFYDTSSFSVDDSQMENSPATSATTNDDITPQDLFTQDDDGLSFFDFDFYTTDAPMQ